MEVETAHTNIHGRMVEILTKLYPKLYQKYIRTKRGKSVLYIEFKKVPYRTLQEDLLLWGNPIYSLHEWVFEIKSYDWYGFNKTVSGKQITIVWRIDDLKYTTWKAARSKK